jgi:hypothetical protein
MFPSTCGSSSYYYFPFPFPFPPFPYSPPSGGYLTYFSVVFEVDSLNKAINFQPIRSYSKLSGYFKHHYDQQ